MYFPLTAADSSPCAVNPAHLVGRGTNDDGDTLVGITIPEDGARRGGGGGGPGRRNRGNRLLCGLSREAAGRGSRHALDPNRPPALFNVVKYSLRRRPDRTGPDRTGVTEQRLGRCQFSNVTVGERARRRIRKKLYGTQIEDAGRPISIISAPDCAIANNKLTTENNGVIASPALCLPRQSPILLVECISLFCQILQISPLISETVRDRAIRKTGRKSQVADRYVSVTVMTLNDREA